MVLSVCALAVCAEKPAATARVRTRDTRFMGKAFRGSSGEHCRHMLENGPTPMIPAAKRRQCRQLPAKTGRAMNRRSQQAPQLAATWIVGAITERLASRVKGLTADFCVLLVAGKPLQPLGLPPYQALRAAVATKSLWCKCMKSSGADGKPTPQQAETRLVTAGRDREAQKGFVNPAVFHGSTVLYPTVEDLHAHRGEYTYGRHGTPTTRALQDVMMALEGPQCAGVGIAPSGLAAISTTLLAVLKTGDHLLVCDNVYRPSRNFCNGVLARYGVETTYFDPLIGAAIEKLFKANTRAVLVEAPVSQSF